MNFEEMLNKISDHVKSMANTDTVIGEEFKLGEFSCKPVIKVGVGFGSGGGTGKDEKNMAGTGGGAGAGIAIAPLGFLVTNGAEISFVPVDRKKGLSAIFDKVPDLMEKMMEMKEKEGKKNKKK